MERGLTSGQTRRVLRYLGLDWIDAMTDAVASTPAMRDAASRHSIAITQVVTGGPEGDVTYHLSVRDGAATFGAGPAEDEDVRFEQDWVTAVGVAQGTASAQEAFITGRIRLYGDQQKLLDCQAVFAALDEAFSTVRERTDYR
jgi:hypothetical protein